MLGIKREYTIDEYEKAMELLKHMGVKRVSKIMGIPKSTLINWKKGCKPWHLKWKPEPSNELAYVLGVLYGDAYLTKYDKSYHYEIRLRVKDKELINNFNEAMSKVLNKSLFKPYYDKSRGIWILRFWSKAFYTWYITQTIEKLKKYIEQSRDTVRLFLRGLYDSEGTHYRYLKNYIRYRINLSNSNVKLLLYTKQLLRQYFGITATGPYLDVSKGSVMIINGKNIKEEKMYIH